MITNFDELKAAIERWLHRSDIKFQGFIDDLVMFAETRINRDLRVRAQEVRARAFLSIGEPIALPDDYLQMRALILLTVPSRTLLRLTPNRFHMEYANPANGQPQHYTTIDQELHLGPAPDSSYEVEMIYYHKLPLLSESNPVNWWIEHAPDLLLYAALLEAASLTQDREAEQRWASHYERAKNAVEHTDRKEQHSGSRLTARYWGGA